MGPLSLSEVRNLARAGTVSGGTFVRRSDSENWSTAADFEELGIKDVVVTAHDAESGPDALTQEAEKFSYLKEVRQGGSWFFWIAGLSVINAIAAWMASGWGFCLGLSTCYLVGGIGQVFGPNGPLIALTLNLAACALYLFFGVASWQGRFTPYAIGMFLYAGDALLPLATQDWISLGIHGVALWFLFKGFGSLMQANNKEWDTGMVIKAAACVMLLVALGGGLIYSMRVAAKELPANPESVPTSPADDSSVKE